MVIVVLSGALEASDPPLAPTITAPPSSKAVEVGVNLSFSVSATGDLLSYQWLKDGISIQGATASTCSLGHARASQSGSYAVVVSNAAGSITSAPPALLTMKPLNTGSVINWGNSITFGQLTLPEGARSGVTAIAAGGLHTAALRYDGSVVAWGDNRLGQTKVPAAAASGVTAIAAGGGFTLAVKEDGTLVVWGANGLGETKIPAGAQNEVAAVSTGFFHAMVLKKDGSLVVWTLNQASTSTVPNEAKTGVVAMAGGYLHSVVLKADGSVVAWGQNFSGQTSVPQTAKNQVVAIAASDTHTLALKADGSLVSWGAKGTLTGMVPPGARTGVKAIACGRSHSVALKIDGSIVAWGSNNDGQIMVPGEAQIGAIAVSAGQSHSAAIVAVPPALTVQRGESQLNLSWPLYHAGFVLQSVRDLNGPIDWKDSMEVPVVSGDRFVVSTDNLAAGQMFRLYRP